MNKMSLKKKIQAIVEFYGIHRQITILNPAQCINGIIELFEADIFQFGVTTNHSLRCLAGLEKSIVRLIPSQPSFMLNVMVCHDHH